MGCGTPIVSEAWISECAKQRRYVDPNAFILQDVMSEKRYKFNLSESLKASRENPIFVKMTFFVTPNTRPLPQELQSEYFLHSLWVIFVSGRYGNLYEFIFYFRYNHMR